MNENFCPIPWLYDLESSFGKEGDTKSEILKRRRDRGHLMQFQFDDSVLLLSEGLSAIRLYNCVLCCGAELCELLVNDNRWASCNDWISALG